MGAKKLACIKKAELGLGGYKEAFLGLHVTLGGNGWGVGDSIGFWDPETIPCSDRAKWSEDDRTHSHDQVMRRVSQLLKDAKADYVSDLVGKPVEVTWKGEGHCGDTLESWRILTEVL